MFEQATKELTNATQVDARSTFRSHERMEFVRTDKNIGEIRAQLPIGRGWNRDGSVIEWVNLGWTPSTEWDAIVNSEKAAAKREDAKVKAKESK